MTADYQYKNLNPHLFEFDFDNLYHINLKKDDNNNIRNQFGDVKVNECCNFFNNE